ncbi:MAG: hypothetical protein LUD51_00210 [Clostridia bacterium]|nr:hypothetical protein [Clostridia bacterium]
MDLQTQKTSIAFRELRYAPGRTLDLSALSDGAMNVLLHTEDLSYSSKVLSYLRYCKDNWKQIDKQYSKNPKELLDAMRQVQVMIPQVPDNQTYNVYYITNATVSDPYTLSPTWICRKQDAGQPASAASLSGAAAPAAAITSEWHRYVTNGQTYSVFPNGRYIMEAGDTFDSVKIMFPDRRLVCTLVSGYDSQNMYLYDSIMPYIFVDYGTATGVYDRNYISTVPAWGQPDTSQMLASLSWCIADDKTQKGIVKLTVYRQCDMEFLLLVAYARLLLFRQFSAHMDQMRRLMRLGLL